MKCPKCGFENRVFSIRCRICKAQLYYKEKYEGLSLKELLKLKKKSRERSFKCFLIGLQSIFGAVPLVFLFLARGVESLSVLSAIFALLTFFIAFIIWLKGISQEVMLEKYIRYADKTQENYYTIGMWNFFRGNLFNLSEEEERAFEYKIRYRIDKLKRYYEKIINESKKMNQIIPVFLILFAFGLPVSLITRDVMIGLSVGFVLGIFAFYPFIKYTGKNEKIQNKIIKLGRDLSQSDFEQYVRYTQKMGLKKGGGFKSAYCILFVVGFFVLFFLMAAVSETGFELLLD